MGDIVAAEIERLWAHYYKSSMTDQEAAGMQIAIWELIGSPVPGSSKYFELKSSNDYGAGDMIAWVKQNSGAPRAYLSAVTSGTGPGQDYIVVPDGGTTVALLGLAFGGLALARRKLRGG